MGWQMADTSIYINVFLETRSNPNAVANFIHSSGSPKTPKKKKKRERERRREIERIHVFILPAHAYTAKSIFRPFLSLRGCSEHYKEGATVRDRFWTVIHIGS
jgi:hypothetical protein